MNKSIEQLMASLDKASEIYAELNTIALRKRVLIQEQQVDQLEKEVATEMGLVASLYKLEEIRGKIVDKLVEERGLMNIENITDIANQLPPDERRALVDKKNKLLIGIKTVGEETRFNSKLLEDKIAMIDLTIQLMGEEGLDQDAIYGRDQQGKSRFDVKV